MGQRSNQVITWQSNVNCVCESMVKHVYNHGVIITEQEKKGISEEVGRRIMSMGADRVVW